MGDEAREHGTAILVLRGLQDQADTFMPHSEGTGAEEDVKVREYHQQMHVSRRAFLQLVSGQIAGAPGSGRIKRGQPRVDEGRGGRIEEWGDRQKGHSPSIGNGLHVGLGRE